MIQYTIDYCDKYMDELLDKLGSDYFPLPIKMGRFVTSTLDFIRENTIYMEASQEISDDIKPLLVRANLVMALIPGQIGIYEVPEPNDYLRLVSVEPYARINGVLTKKYKKISVIKEGQRLAYERDPFREPSALYPSVYRNTNIFEINVGNDTDVYDTAKVSYIKYPTFGDIENDDDIIVNLPPIAIEQIMLKVAESLRFTSADESAAAIYQFDQTFGKRNK